MRGRDTGNSACHYFKLSTLSNYSHNIYLDVDRFILLLICVRPGQWPLPGAHDAPAPVNGDGLPGDEACLVARQEPDESRHLVCAPDPAQGVRGLGMFKELGIGLLRHPAGLVHLSDDHTGIDGVDPDSLTGQVEGGAPDQHVQSGLADTVAQHPGEAAEPGDTGDMDHVPLGGDDVRGAQLGQDEGRPRVDVHQLVIIRDAQGLDTTIDQDSRAVNEDVKDPSE